MALSPPVGGLGGGVLGTRPDPGGPKSQFAEEMGDGLRTTDCDLDRISRV